MTDFQTIKAQMIARRKAEAESAASAQAEQNRLERVKTELVAIAKLNWRKLDNLIRTSLANLNDNVRDTGMQFSLKSLDDDRNPHLIAHYGVYQESQLADFIPENSLIITFDENSKLHMAVLTAQSSRDVLYNMDAEKVDAANIDRAFEQFVELSYRG